MTGDSRPYALGPGEGRFVDLGDFGMTVKASTAETAGVVSVVEAEEPPGFGPPIHVHHDCAEAFYVLDVVASERRKIVEVPGHGRRPRVRVPRRLGTGSGWEMCLFEIHAVLAVIHLHSAERPSRTRI